MSTSFAAEERHGSPRSVHPWDGNALVRRQAKILDPVAAVPALDGSALAPTIYLPEWLLVPTDLRHDNDIAGVLARVLVAFKLAPRLSAEQGPLTPVRLVRAENQWLERPIDAWAVRQALQVAGANHSRPLSDKIARIGLRHLFVAQDLTGHPLLGTPGMEGHHDGTGKLPVYLPQQPPARTVLEPGLRRPVVAILDTGCCGTHPWLGRDGNDGFVDASLLPPGDNQECSPDRVNPLIGEVDSHSGHGTFLAGIVRQLAPNARVLPVPVMSSDGTVDEAVLVQRLTELKTRVLTAQREGATAEEVAGFVDIVLMAFGGYLEQPDASRALHDVLYELAGLGVILIAAAGNDATSAEIYPAAYDFVYGVGALANSTQTAIFSNVGRSADKWAPGYAVVSTLPDCIQGSRPPSRIHPAQARAGYDPDEYWSGFGIWSGTSFAAGTFASKVAGCLLSPTVPMPPLTRVTAAEATARRTRALCDAGGNLT
ncbi:MAG TPA: S8 family serine peptidase [Pseudonocardiaceae bacterium]|nr:S8 family serine peptidase [Pseudonocardiaceae bacterium]